MDTAGTDLIQPASAWSGWPIMLAMLWAAALVHAHVQLARLRRQLQDLDARHRAAQATAQTLRNEMEMQVCARTSALQARNADLVRQRRALIMANQRLARLATNDALTGLANRRRFDHALEQQLRRAGQRSRPVSLIYLDLDGFKRFNDRHGHGRGDQVLREVAGALQDTCQRHDALVARHGGEEFAVLLPGLNARHARIYAERLRRKVWQLGIISHAASEEGTSERVTISAGVITASPAQLLTHAQRPAQLATTMLQAVDQALYRAKSQGRNRIVIATGWNIDPHASQPPATDMEMAS